MSKLEKALEELDALMDEVNTLRKEEEEEEKRRLQGRLFRRYGKYGRSRKHGY